MRFEHWLYTVPLRLRSLFRRRRVEQDLDDELRYHLERQTEDLASAGLSPDDARAAARRRFGGVEHSKEYCRDARKVSFIDTLRQDVRYGARTLRRSPGFTAIAALTLALGIGANSAVFSLVDGILLRPLPYAAPDRLVSLTGTYPTGAFVALRDRMRTMDAAAYADWHAFNLEGVSEATRVTGASVSAELFSVLGTQPALGRTFRRGEDTAGQDRVVILSHALWEQRFASDPAIVGRSVVLEGVSRQVVGVMPAAFQFPSITTQLWIPLRYDPRNTVGTWASDFMPVIGRLRPGSTIAEARADVQLFQSRVGALFPWRMPASWNRDISVLPLQQSLVSPVRTRLLVLLGAVALVLLIACANVANLTLSRAATREREIGIRAALGAAPRRIARQLITESVLLASLGAALGLVLATQGLSLLKAVLPAGTPRLADAQMNWRVLIFTAAIAVVTGCLFGLAPVLHSLRLGLTQSLESGGRSGGPSAVSDRLRIGLTIAEIACAVLLVTAAALLLRSLWTLSHVDPGFRTEQIVTARVAPNQSLCGEPSRCLSFYRTLQERVQATPGVDGAALVNTLPLAGSVAKRAMELQGYKPPPSEGAPLFWLTVVTPDYFRVMGIRLISGRPFTDADLTGNPSVAMVSAATARRFWPGEQAIGKQVLFVGETEWRTITAVVADVRAWDIERDRPEWMHGTIYVPYGPKATLEGRRIPAEMTLTIRTRGNRGGGGDSDSDGDGDGDGDEARIGATVRRLVADISREATVSDVKPMRAIVAEVVAAPTSTTSLFTTFAALALTLGSIGVYGVMSFLVARRTRDIGIRLALGAQRRDVSWLVLKEGATVCAAGIALGVAAAVATTRLLASELHAISPLDPLTYGGVALVVALVTLLACYVPMRRAMRVDPLIALRSE